MSHYFCSILNRREQTKQSRIHRKPCSFTFPAAPCIPLCNFAEIHARGGGGLQQHWSQRFEPGPGHRHLTIYHFINYLLYLLVAQLSVEGYFVAVNRQLLEKGLCALYLCILFTAQRRLILDQLCFDNDI